MIDTLPKLQINLMKNFMELSTFCDEWRDFENFNPSFFSATVIYNSVKYGRETEKCTINVYRAIPRDGNIVILSNGVLQSETHHLEVSPIFQTYQFDEDDASLVIRGNSEKMGGNYSIKLTPNGGSLRFN